MEKVEKGGRLVSKDDTFGLQKVIISRSQSLDGPLKDYLENLEHAFIRAKFRKSQYSQVEENQFLLNPIDQIRESPDEESSLDNSASFVQETRESLASEEEQEKEEVSFKSIPATREVDGVEIVPPKVTMKKSWKSNGKGSKLQGKNPGNSDIRGEEISFQGGSLSSPPMTHADCSAPSISDSSVGRPTGTRSYLLYIRIRVYPCVPDISFPNGITVLEISKTGGWL
ncbi:hypothetical protein EZV62_008561 [Acer yangbiense]|uniref:Uncharacterized protein n=1 Tax=Acer yangbiense TaxID=1000413 RepID=A0A5C7IFR2_9ROSI|nr:hypothetical protein EZV62_008561 [Acer yangbiense]